MNTPAADAYAVLLMDPTVLDAAQLVRIQATHSGFLYQHVYAVACLLSAPSTGVVRVRVERDEDVELVLRTRTVYAQVKKREAPLAPSDIDSVIERFDKIRAAHQSGERAGDALFALVTNSELGPTLAGRSWPPNVLILTPTTPANVFEHTGLVAAAPSIEHLFRDAEALAEGFRLSALRPESLVRKLIGVIAQASAGGRAPSLDAADLDDLCEWVAAQVRRIPRAATYRPQVNEPRLPEGRSSLVVLGHGGDGKSTWAAEVAAHAAEVVVYLPLSSAAGEQVAPRLVDLAVTILVKRRNVRPFELVLPGRTGIDALAALDEQLVTRSILLTAIVDDCHYVPASTIIDAMRAGPNIRWVLLGRPCEALSEVAATMSLPREVLGGWDDDVVAALLHEAKCSTRPADVVALRSATKGAPLFVAHAVRAISESGTDTGAYARAIVAGTTIERTPQDVVLEQAVLALDMPSARVASALGSIELGLRLEEWAELLTKALGDAPDVTRRALRVLVERQIAYKTQDDIVSVHDAFRGLLGGRILTPGEAVRVRECAADLLRDQLLDERASERIIAYVRILASLGRLSELADIANALSEWFRETGTIGEVRGHVEASLRQGDLSPEGQFWALDTLAFFDIEDDAPDQAASRIPEMARLAASLDDAARGAVLHKKVLVAYRRKNIAEVRGLLKAPVPDPKQWRILRYHGALAEAQAGEVQRAVLRLRELATEYLAELGLTPISMFAKNPAQLRAIMHPNADVADMRHLADCYFAIVRVSAPNPELRASAALPAVWSMKFYELAGAIRSILRAGQETVAMMLDYWDDPNAARSFLEQSLLPALRLARLPEMIAPIRSQYAVVCASCNDFVRADAEMTALAPYADSLAPADRAELDERRAQIEQLRARGSLSGSALAARRARKEARDRGAELMRAQLSAPLRPSASKTGKPGRNTPCPCGSGWKYKKCCGAAA